MKYHERVYKGFAKDLRDWRNIIFVYTVPACASLFAFCRVRTLNNPIYYITLGPVLFTSLNIFTTSLLKDASDSSYSHSPIKHMGHGCDATSRKVAAVLSEEMGILLLQTLIPSNSFASDAVKVAMFSLLHQSLGSFYNKEKSITFREMIKLAGCHVLIFALFSTIRIENRLLYSTLYSALDFGAKVVCYDAKDSKDFGENLAKFTLDLLEEFISSKIPSCSHMLLNMTTSTAVSSITSYMRSYVEEPLSLWMNIPALYCILKSPRSSVAFTQQQTRTEQAALTQ